MYFITKKNSATGKKFQDIKTKMDECLAAQKKLSKEIGFTEWRRGYWVVAGGISAVVFPKSTTVDTKVWKNVNGKKNEWMPRMNVKAGKEIKAKFEALPVVTIKELNACIGFDETMFRTIGANFGSKTYIGFIVEEDWKVKIPADCTEVTTSKYNSIFKN